MAAPEASARGNGERAGRGTTLGRRLATLLVAVAISGALSVACGTDGDSPVASEARAGTAGSVADGGTNQSGGNNAVGGKSGGGGGGTNAGGSSSAGSGGAVSSGNGCHSGSDCQPSNPSGPIPSVTQCLSPGQAPPPASCGAPGWCGRCNCGAQPQAPFGNGMPCQTSSDCPAAKADLSTASVCDLGSCTQCAAAADCPASAPACGSVMAGFGQQFRVCVECGTDADCPSSKPHCGGSKCFVCAADKDCATGICSSGACVPGCTAQTPCPNPLTACGASQRCEPITCQNDGACPANASCQQGYCARRACAKDSECDSGGCVNGACYETLGSCYTQTFPP